MSCKQKGRKREKWGKKRKKKKRKNKVQGGLSQSVNQPGRRRGRRKKEHGLSIVGREMEKEGGGVGWSSWVRLSFGSVCSLAWYLNTF